MRKPLLDKYRTAEPALDGIRRQVIADELNPTPEPGFWAIFWQELFVKPRMAWGGMAAVWLVALILNLSSGSEPTKQMAQQPVEPTPEVMRMVREQQQLRDELLGIGVAAVELSPADKPRDGLKPRSERREALVMV
jgi:hypothetical protein